MIFKDVFSMKAKYFLSCLQMLSAAGLIVDQCAPGFLPDYHPLFAPEPESWLAGVKGASCAHCLRPTLHCSGRCGPATRQELTKSCPPGAARAKAGESGQSAEEQEMMLEENTWAGVGGLEPQQGKAAEKVLCLLECIGDLIST